ncbi:MAG: class I SAM-dependent DNA methyltransferase [Gammaproteobacteria bacterium]|nr:class I SAM-dependent DNA methyltransferase [Gammaproteobacteria bacterium]MDE0413085.1 class I SAM-dependent DNA methyltransferase [Gammaproteobacteria bacterium]
MRLSWNEVRVRAATFADEWSSAVRETSETHSFYNAFFRVFGVERRSVARYEEHVAKLDNSSGFIDLFWPGVLIVEQKSAGRDLSKAYGQAGEYFDALKERDRPRYILVSDFQTFELHDLDERTEVRFGLKDLPANVEHFGFILGVQKRTFRDQDPANIKAAELVGRLHDALHAANYRGHDLERFLVRIVFCLFADDTGIFEPRDILLEFIETRTSEDGADLGPWLRQVFEVLNSPEDERSPLLDEDLARFPYVNGDLFREHLRTPSFNASMREALLDVCRFDWSNISPAIFGALFQSVMEPEQRRAQGAHYTTEKNILKVIEPLFMDDLRAEFQRLKSRKDSRRRADLQRFQEKLGKLRFFDPACGCGNFLIISYRELRLLELEVIRELRTAAARLGQEELDVATLSLIDVDQFYGIEISELPARIAETAMWMMDHIMNNRLSLEFGQTYARIPLETSPHIVHGDALETDWAEVLPPERCSYLFGNPPFGGFVMRNTAKQLQTKNVMVGLGAGGSRLDYVAAWFLKAGDYFNRKTARIAFVATNSITQGEQVAQLWPAMFDRYGLEITLAHRTFPWGSDARGMAHVHVVIIGLSDAETAPARRRLFLYDNPTGEPNEIEPSRIGPYLQDASGLADSHLTINRQRSPISGLPKIGVGTKPVDGGHYILDRADRDKLLELEPNAGNLLRPFFGGREFINGLERWLLCVTGFSPSILRSMPNVMERISAVRDYREYEGGKLAKSLANQPTEFHVTVLPTTDFLVIPEVSSERREYVPIGYLKPPVIPSNQLLVVQNATLPLFALLISTIHMAWLRYVGGRLESRYRYSSGLVYNTFPVPPQDADLTQLEPLAQAVLEARTAHADSTLADLYEPNLMPPDLRKAHQALDRAVDRLYRRSGFASERERVEHLFTLYEKMRSPLVTRQSTKKRKRQKVK